MANFAKEEEKIPNAKATLNYAIGGCCNCLNKMFKINSEDEEFCEKLAKMVGSSTSIITMLFKHALDEDTIMAKYGTQLLRNVFAHNLPVVYQTITSTKSLKKSVVKTLVRGLGEEHKCKEVSDNLMVVFKKIGKKDAAGIGKEVRDALRDDE